mmetsp:Transcript_23995/g.48174  ORF Transcript_23995/g.48174 Transcript_23995/m.48174 type:complete len:84 (-) Transcript_23995:119-370(-)
MQDSTQHSLGTRSPARQANTNKLQKDASILSVINKRSTVGAVWFKKMWSNRAVKSAVITSLVGTAVLAAFVRHCPLTQRMFVD